MSITDLTKTDYQFFINDGFEYQFNDMNGYLDFPITKKQLHSFEEYIIDRILMNFTEKFEDSSVGYKIRFNQIKNNPIFKKVYSELYNEWKVKTNSSYSYETLLKNSFGK